jgi:hypothetical protein
VLTQTGHRGHDGARATAIGAWDGYLDDLAAMLRTRG